jgi:hypothetical protein
MTTASYADDDDRRRGDKRRGEHRSWAHEHGYQHYRHRDDDWRRRDWRDGYTRGQRHDYSYREAWPPLHRYGRRCGDRRHYRDVHYHVRARDYYDYYYPRYRYYGAAPLESHASVIITLPLF